MVAAQTTPEQMSPTVPTSPEGESLYSVWRLDPGGHLLTSVVERQASWMAEREPDVIYFYADLGGSTELINKPETMQKVYQALANVGLSEGQIINATTAMQIAGILFREQAN